jgi:hypothetical protein
VLGCFSVIAVHAVGAPFPAESVGLGATTFLLHYSREMFLFVSALVLARTHLPRMDEDGRLPDTATVCRRRLRVIGLPYLTWTAVYLLLAQLHAAPLRALPTQLPAMPELWLTAVLTAPAGTPCTFCWSPCSTRSCSRGCCTAPTTGTRC